MKNLFTALLVLFAPYAFALNPADFTVQQVSAPYFIVDSNNPSSGPQSGYVGFEVTNTGGTTYSNLKFTITSIGTSIVGQNYNLVSPASGVILVGTLAPGQSKVCYYFVSYPANTTAGLQGTFYWTLSDATASSKTGSFVIQNKTSISASAGGLATQAISSQDLIGGIVMDTVTYSLGNTQKNDYNDFQASVSTGFDPTKLVLISTKVTASNVPGIPVGSTDSLFYLSTANQSSSSVTIVWKFKISNYGFTTLLLPYAGATSGASNYKYAINGAINTGTSITIPSTANPLVITKTSDKALYGTCATSIFTVTIQNPGAYPISIDKITDQVPSGFTYQALDVASEVTTSNSTSYPSAGATGTITFEGGVVSGSTTSYAVPAGGSLILKYSATAACYTTSNLTTSAAGFVGTTQIGTAQNTISVSATLPVMLQSFSGNFVSGKVRLEWSTSSETNSSSFDLERSGDGIGFSKIGTVRAGGNALSARNYSFLDSFPLMGVSYYRLRLNDASGDFKYSPVISVIQDRNASFIEVLGNPFYGRLELKIEAIEKQDVQIKLFDRQGVLVAKQVFHCNSGSNRMVINGLDGLSKGSYFLQADIDGKTLTRQVVKN